MNRTRVMGFLAIICTAVFWGLSFVSIKITLAVIPPMTLALFRFLIALAILFMLLKKWEPETKIAMRDMPSMALSGVLGVTMYFYFQNHGVKLTTASAASMIIAAIPIMTVVGESLLFKTKLTLAKIAGVILSIGGVYLIIASPAEVSPDHFAGNLFMLGSAVAWVLYSLATRPLSTKYSQLAVASYQILFGTIALVPFVFFETFDWRAIDLTIVLHLLYLGCFCSALANYLYVYAMGILGVSSVSLFINLVPVISVLGGLIILQEPVSALQIIGGAVILFSVYIANRDIERTAKTEGKNQAATN